MAEDSYAQVLSTIPGPVDLNNKIRILMEINKCIQADIEEMDAYDDVFHNIYHREYELTAGEKYNIDGLFNLLELSDAVREELNNPPGDMTYSRSYGFLQKDYPDLVEANTIKILKVIDIQIKDAVSQVDTILREREVPPVPKDDRSFLAKAFGVLAAIIQFPIKLILSMLTWPYRVLSGRTADKPRALKSMGAYGGVSRGFEGKKKVPNLTEYTKTMAERVKEHKQQYPLAEGETDTAYAKSLKLMDKSIGIARKIGYNSWTCG